MGEKTKDPFYKQLYEVESLRPALLGTIRLFIDCVRMHSIFKILRIFGIPFLLLTSLPFSNHPFHTSIKLVITNYTMNVNGECNYEYEYE